MSASRPDKSTQLDILAIAAHRDDVEQTCGGTLLKMAQKGQHTGILDLTQGEMGTRGSAADREREANEAARLLRVEWRRALEIGRTLRRGDRPATRWRRGAGPVQVHPG